MELMQVENVWLFVLSYKNNNWRSSLENVIIEINDVMKTNNKKRHYDSQLDTKISWILNSERTGRPFCWTSINLLNGRNAATVEFLCESKSAVHRSSKSLTLEEPVWLIYRACSIASIDKQCSWNARRRFCMISWGLHRLWSWGDAGSLCYHLEMLLFGT